MWRATRSQEILDELEQLLSRAKPVPLTDQVRVEGERARELLQQLREALAEGR
jgi:hypothetical protein